MFDIVSACSIARVGLPHSYPYPYLGVPVKQNIWG